MSACPCCGCLDTAAMRPVPDRVRCANCGEPRWAACTLADAIVGGIMRQAAREQDARKVTG